MPAEQVKQQLADKSILIVDDDELFRSFLTDLLKAEGFSLIIAEHGREALARYETEHEKIGLIILDLIMPQLNGMKTFKVIRQLNPEAKVLICTGHPGDTPSSEAELEAVKAAKGVAYLQKPFRPEMFHKTVLSLFEDKKNQEAES